MIERFCKEADRLGRLLRTDTTLSTGRVACALDGYIDVRGNRYSAPSEYCGTTVTVRIGLCGDLRIYADDVKVAEHRLRKVSEGWGRLGLIMRGFGKRRSASSAVTCPCMRR